MYYSMCYYFRLKLLSVAGIAAAVKNYIEKSDGAAIPSIVERQMNKVYLEKKHGNPARQ